MIVRGELEAPGDLVIEGRVEGAVRAGNDLFIETGAEVDADAFAERIVIAGSASGRVVAGTSVEVRSTAEVDAVLVAPIVSVADGAKVRGRIEMVVDIAEASR
jgi:cytoskeletal protein CcmA (bactofilin family)